MNLLFGTTAPPASRSSKADLVTAVRALHGEAVRVVTSESAPLLFGQLCDGGAVLGCAHDGELTLGLLGPISGPLPGWKCESPLDDPNRTAAFLLDRFKRDDVRFLDGLVGQFAAVVVDSARGRLLLAADPAGMRTLYLHRDGESLTFASNLQALARGLGSELEIDRSLEDFFLIHGFYPWGRTPYRDVTALAPGTLLEWCDGKETPHEIVQGDPWVGRYDSLLSEQVDEETVLDGLYEAILRATKEQLAGTPRVAVLLGGFDSALVAALLHRLGKEVETYSFHYEDGQYNQPHTDTLARHLGIQHHWVPITQEIIEDGLQHFATLFNQPTNWPNYVIQTDYLCKRIRETGITHCYTGDGCDATFLGYPGTYRRARVFQALPRLPEGLHQAILSCAAWPLLDRLLGHPYRVALNMLRALGRDMPARGYLSFRILDELSVAQLRDGRAPAAEQPLEEIIETLAKPFTALPPLRLAYQGKAAVSPNKNKIIGSSDHNGVAILSPYMHPGLKALATRLPEHLMRPQADNRSKVTGKYILMRMAEAKGLLPPEVIYQRKVAAVDGPIDRWYAGPMKPTLLSMLVDLPFDYRESYVESLIRPKLAESLFKRYLMTDKVVSHAVSLLATYASFTAAARPSSAPQQSQQS